MTVVLVHGSPETAAIWRPLQAVLPLESVALSLPGFGSPRPAGWVGTKDALAGWLAKELARLPGPVDVVGHDVGGLLTMRVASAFDVPLRSWASDVPDIFHPAMTWPDRVHELQKPGVGEALLKATRDLPEADPKSLVSRLRGVGLPIEIAREVAGAHDGAMSLSVLDFYRSAIPNVAADWWKHARPTPSRGLVLLAPDPPEIQARSLETAKRLGAETASLGNLEHCWMADDPRFVAEVLERFWRTLP
ncbi:MAG TPA: alpha/beta hydrolase [Planctomycetota bacterium]|nr:alpha/beta hydrolase [Planctomycetota bacterium]